MAGCRTAWSRGTRRGLRREAADNFIWVLNSRGAVEKIDPDTSRVVAVFTRHVSLLLASNHDLAVGRDEVWISHSNPDTAEDGMIRIDPATGAVRRAMCSLPRTEPARGAPLRWRTTTADGRGRAPLPDTSPVPRRSSGALGST